MTKTRKYLLLALWLVLAAAAAPLAVKLTTVQDNESLGALPASAESNRALARARAAFPEPDAPVAVAVYVRDSGLTDADRSRVEADRAAFGRYADGAVPPPVPSEDGRAILVSFRVGGDDDTRSTALGEIKDLLNGAPAGLRTALTGPAGAERDVFDAFDGMDANLLLATAATVALLLLLTYRSPVLWLVPLVAVAVANQVAAAAVYLLAKHAGLAVDLQSQTILTVLVFGVGVDYALLLIARYREELRHHADRHAAMGVALRRSFPAICASAATVAIALLCLLAAALPATRGLGPVAAVGVAATLLAMTTLLPALLVLCGRWLFWPFVPRYGTDAADEPRFWGALARGVGRWPRAIWVGSVLVLAALALGIGKLSVGLPVDGMFTKEVGSVAGQRLIEAHYPRGTVAPARILATAPSADRVAAAARAVDGVAEVLPAEVSADGRWVRVDAVLAATPDSRAAEETVKRLRAAVRAVSGAEALVGGQTATNVDEADLVARDNRLILPLILLVVLGILVVLLRALVAPLLLMVSVVASYAAAMGAAGLILDAIGHPRLWVGLPLQTFLFLVALGVDYTIFLMTRAREEVARRGHRPGVLHALAVTGGVITSAGVVLAATFGALSVLPLVPSVQTGVIVAVGVLLDTFLVRSLLIPALSVHIGHLTWWPGALSRVPPAPVPVPAPLARVA